MTRQVVFLSLMLDGFAEQAMSLPSGFGSCQVMGSRHWQSPPIVGSQQWTVPCSAMGYDSCGDAQCCCPDGSGFTGAKHVLADGCDDFSDKNSWLCSAKQPEWSECSKSCGGGTRNRVRCALDAGDWNDDSCLLSVAAGVEMMEEECNNQPCAVDCVGSWGDWSSCSHGAQSRTRSYKEDVHAEHGGAPCPPRETEVCSVSAIEPTVPTQPTQPAEPTLRPKRHVQEQQQSWWSSPYFAAVLLVCVALSGLALWWRKRQLAETPTTRPLLEGNPSPADEESPAGDKRVPRGGAGKLVRFQSVDSIYEQPSIGRNIPAQIARLPPGPIPKGVKIKPSALSGHNHGEGADGQRREKITQRVAAPPTGLAWVRHQVDMGVEMAQRALGRKKQTLPRADSLARARGVGYSPDRTVAHTRSSIRT
eukprot:gnl/TRDRNA2_/TRDRNA2_69880_c0_seq2.p1 gnl/TRDRNA2_/TRDRNA2_69880_c0~~gnl/TRDRNA2_/TRDRNA2_69880_c0_seq2.p1  ORF type:complete len:420 (-),score=36.96 gnl/TRDRNA2_/TRDRNA2_69880_c0_seq2:88-1347(-)